MELKIAFILFDGITWLDLIGIYDPISRLRHMGYLPDLQWDFCARTERVGDHFGATFCSTKNPDKLSGYDVLIIPGGYGTRSLQTNPSFIDWLKTGADARYKISICTGSLLLGAAGFLKGKTATTHFSEYTGLGNYCTVSTERIVEDGDVITAGAVSSSLDLGIYLCEKWVSREAADSIRGRMDYHYSMEQLIKSNSVK
ncbi:MAG TPA: DJ-1/PfpI family protein [Flavitalea sp.]|nr:DJ-1/PfpI family protein [Flavitalea sp.]